MTMTRGRVVGSLAVVGLLGLSAAGQAAAQVAEQIMAGEDGTVRFSFRARPDVEICDHGVRWGEDSMRWRWKGDRDDGMCERGRVGVALRVIDGLVRDIEVVRPGAGLDEASSGPVTELGSVEPGEASDYLLALVYEGATRSAAEDAIFPAMLADGGDRWPALLVIARDGGVHRGVRKSALFWVGQAAAEAVASELSEVATDDGEDQEIRNAAIFALSQRDDDESIPVLMEIARDGDEAETRKTAMFWLAQSEDPRVVRFFEDVLLGRRR